MQENSRWWEFYFVRYAIGTLVGTIFVNLIGDANPEIRKAVFFGADASKEFFAGTPLLLGLGLLFCYVASIPILVWHSARFVIPKIGGSAPSNPKKRSGAETSKMKSVLVLSLISTVGLLLLHSLVFLWKNLRDQDFLIQIGIWSGLLVLWLEWGAMVWLMANREQAYRSLRKLASARHKNGNKGGLIDSYRHLREHGNSVLIVVLELVLGGILLGMSSVIGTDSTIPNAGKTTAYAASALPILVLWILPGAAVWFVATSFEKKFVELEGVD